MSARKTFTYTSPTGPSFTYTAIMQIPDYVGEQVVQTFYQLKWKRLPGFTWDAAGRVWWFPVTVMSWQWID